MASAWVTRLTDQGILQLKRKLNPPYKESIVSLMRVLRQFPGSLVHNKGRLIRNFLPNSVNFIQIIFLTNYPKYRSLSTAIIQKGHALYLLG